MILWSMRLLSLVLLILVCHHVSGIFASNLTSCFKEELVQSYGSTVRNRTVQGGTSYKVFGITPFCYVYVGWLHSILDSYNNQTEHDAKVDITSTACKDKQIIQMMTEGKRETVLLAVDRFGRRIRIQSVANSPVVRENLKGMMWLKFAHNDRRQQMLTNNIEKGFVIQSIAKIRNRVMVICISAVATKIYELKVLLDRNTLKPYLETKDPILIKSDLVTPMIGLNARSVPDLFVNGRTEVPILKYNRTTGIDDYLGNEFIGTKTSGFVFYHTANIATPMTNVGPALTFSSMVSGAVLDFHGGYSLHERFLFKSETGLVLQVPLDPKCVALLGGTVIYKYISKNDAILSGNDTFRMDAPHTTLYAMSIRPYLNSVQHRRMAYPHAINTNIDQHYLDIGWAVCSPVIFGTLGCITVLGTVYKVITHLKNKKLRRKGVTTSLSNAYSL